MKCTFFDRAVWDDEVNVWYSETDIEGLIINAKDLNEFEEVMNEFAGDRVLENHWRRGQVPEEMINKTVPIILSQGPNLTSHAA